MVIRIKDLPLNNAPNPNQFLATDLTATQRLTIQETVDTGAPVNSQAEAEAGVVNTGRMTPLTTKQAIFALGATAAQGALADTAVQPGDLATVAFSGDYNDLIDKPTLSSTLIFPIKADAAAATIPTSESAVMTNGSLAVGDGLGGMYIDVDNGSSDTFTSSGGTARTWYLAKDVDAKRLVSEDLAAIAALTSAADKVPYATGAGTWSLADFTANGRSIVAASAANDVRNILDTAPYVATRTALKALDTTKDTVSILKEAGREGVFVWTAGDFSTEITADTAEGIYLKADAIASTAGAWVRFYTGGMSPMWFGAVGGGADDTAPLQTVLNLIGTIGGCLDWGGAWSVSKLSIATGAAFFELRGNAEITANSGSAQDSLIEIQRGNFSITGSIAAVGDYRTNYDCGFWVWNASQLQAVVFDKLIAAGCTVGLKVGHPTYPSAIISENTFEGFRTYGCPEVMHVIGAQTYAMIGNPPAMSADAFGGDAAWQARPKRVLVNIGSNTVVTAGELLQTTSVAVTDYVFEMRPILAGAELSWGRLKVQGPYIETVGPLCLINNPGGLTGLNTAKDRGRFVCTFADGFTGTGTDSGSFIKASADFPGDIIVLFPNFWFQGTRTSPNIECLGNLAHVYIIGANFGGGFISPLAGVSGGILHFERRDILQAYDLPASALSSGVLKFQSVVTGGDLSRWQSLYSSSTGGFTVPPGGLREIRIFASLKATGITGSLVVKKGATVVETRASSVNAFTIEFTELEPAAGSVYTVELSIASGSGSPTTNAGANTMIIEAAR